MEGGGTSQALREDHPCPGPASGSLVATENNNRHTVEVLGACSDDILVWNMHHSLRFLVFEARW